MKNLNTIEVKNNTDMFNVLLTLRNESETRLLKLNRTVSGLTLKSIQKQVNTIVLEVENKEIKQLEKFKLIRIQQF